MKCKLNSKILCLVVALLLLDGLTIGGLMAKTNSLTNDTSRMLPLTEVLDKISQKYEVIFSYESQLLQEVEVDFVFKNGETIDSVIDRLFSQTNLRYKTIGQKYYVIHQNEKVGNKPSKKGDDKIEQIQKLDHQRTLSLKNIQQFGSSMIPSIIDLISEIRVSGQVTLANGDPLIGVNIQVEGTFDGTTTDLDGNFTIDVPEGSRLVFSYLGMETQTIEVGNQKTLNVIMKEVTSQLDEIVVIGYSSQTKESLTGSVSTLKSADLEQAPTSTFEQSLRGSIAGIQASALDGAPGSNTEVRIRGIGSITASSEPLYVIDGIPIQAGSLATNDNDGASSNIMASINPNDIESISILKDAASTAIYGSRGANGVILITTKQGNSGKATIDLKTLVGFNSQASRNILKPINAAQYTELFLEGYINRGDTPERAQQRFDALFTQLVDPSTGKPTDTNWLDAITRTGVTQSYDLSARGGTDKVKYFMSGNFMDQESYIIGYGFRRFGTRTNLEYKVNDYITISNNISLSDISSTTSFDEGSFNNPFKNTLELSPLIPIYDEQGRFNAEHANYFPLGGANPVGSLSGDDLWSTQTSRIIDNFAVSAKLLKNLTFRSQWNFDILSINESQYLNPRYGGGRNSNGYAYEATTDSKTWVGTQTLDYNFLLGKSNNFNILAGYEAQKTSIESHNASGTQFPNDKVRTLNSASADFTIGGSRSEYTFLSMFTRANYNYAGKYFLSGSLRRDGSSRFGSDKRYGTFYSIGASWILTRESFLKDISSIDFLKLRTSYGLTGNASIGNFPSQGLYTYGQDYDGSPGGIPSQIGNPDLTWETQNNFNIGLDFGLFNRVDGTVEYFKRVSSDLLLDVPISSTTGFTSLTQNFGEMTNSGLELTMNTDIINNKNFRWSIGFNATFIKNKITKLPENYVDDAFRREEGLDFQSYYLYNWAGVNQENGDPQWYTDASKTEITTNLANAERFLDGKSASPDVFGGFNTSSSYKGFSFSANFMYSSGNYVFDSRARGSLGDGRLTPRSTASWLYENRWVPGKTDALVPKFIWGGRSGSNEPFNSRWLYDGSFIRLKDLTIGYSIPERVTSTLKVNSARVYVRGTNILTFTKDADLYIDPEQAINGNYLALTPAMKTISFGIDIQL